MVYCLHLWFASAVYCWRLCWHLVACGWFITPCGSILFALVYTVGTCGCFVAPCGSIQLSHMVALAHNNQNSDCTNAKNSDNFNLFDITDDEISSYPWKINNSDMHERVKKCLRDIDITNINYDEPIRSSIIDTDNPPTWIKNEFSDDEWKVISSNDNCHYKKFIRRSERFFSNSEGSAIKNHLPEKSSKASSERKNSVISNSSSENFYKENEKPIKKKRKRNDEFIPRKRKKIGRKPDLMIMSKTRLFQKKLEFFVGEVSNSPWKEKSDKTNKDRKKLIRMLKDIYDHIAKTFFSKYLYLNINSFKNLEIYGIQITGFKMKIFCFDKPGFGLYRVRKVDEITIPVNIKDDFIDRTFEGLMTKVYVNNIKTTISSQRKGAKNLQWEKSLPKTMNSP
ncbi:12395_t:CDS:2 [Rhizophagus irregularis]|nr:12395_t:CDS:2 [Rhizophagus irregularis]